MRSFKGTLRHTVIVLLVLATGLSQDTGSARIAGHVQIGQGTTPLIARLYSPKASYAQAQQGAAQADGSSRRVRIAFVGGDGHFEFPDLKPGSYLLEIYSGDRLLYQKVVSTQDTQPLEIAVNVVPESTQSPLVFKKHGWHPADIASDPRAGVFVLDNDGEVSKLSGGQGSGRIDTLFRLKGAYQGFAVAASAQSVYVAANSHLGCVVVRYFLSGKTVAERLLAVNEKCAGIASDGTAIYVSLPRTSEIRYLSSWNDSSSHTWTVNDPDALGPMTFDPIGNRLIVADDSGKAYAIARPDGAKQLLTSNLGWVNSIAASRQHILVASGTKVLSFSRSDNHGENPPPSLQSLTGGHIVGVAVDENDKAWFADYDKGLVEGPLPLN